MLDTMMSSKDGASGLRQGNTTTNKLYQENSKILQNKVKSSLTNQIYNIRRNMWLKIMEK